MSAPHSPEWEQFWKDADSAPIGEIAARLGVTLKRAAADLSGPCPFGCCTTDGFVVTPAKGKFVCRKSGEGGRVVAMVAHAQGVSNVEAAEFILERDRPGGRREETEEERAARAAKRAEWQAATAKREADEARALEVKQRQDEEYFTEVLARAAPIAGTHGEAYFRRRALAPSRRFLVDLKFVRDLDYWGFADPAAKARTHLVSLPAIVAVIRNVAGDMIGIHQTFLDPREPIKWVAPHERDLEPSLRRNKAKKIRGEAKGGMIRLGSIGERLAIAEGIETALSWHALGFGPEDVTLAAAISQGNLCGGSKQTIPHPVLRNEAGKPVPVPNGEPDPDKPGVILPDWVREVIIIGDGDSEPISTEGFILTQARRWRASGRVVSVAMSPRGFDFNDVLERQAKELVAA